MTTIDTTIDGVAHHKPSILNAQGYERLKTLMLGTTLKLDSTLVAFKGLISERDLDQHVDQDFYYEFDKLLFVYSRQIGDDRYSQLVDKHKTGFYEGMLNQSSIAMDDHQEFLSAGVAAGKGLPTSQSVPLLPQEKVIEKEEVKPIVTVTNSE